MIADSTAKDTAPPVTEVCFFGPSGFLYGIYQQRRQEGIFSGYYKIDSLFNQAAAIDVCRGFKDENDRHADNRFYTFRISAIIGRSQRCRTVLGSKAERLPVECSMIETESCGRINIQPLQF